MASSTGNIKQAYDVNGEKIYPKVILDAIEGEGGKTGMEKKYQIDTARYGAMNVSLMPKTRRMQTSFQNGLRAVWKKSFLLRSHSHRNPAHSGMVMPSCV